MPQLSRFTIRWTPRDYPLPPVAAAARGEASLRLARKLLQLDDESLGKLEGVAGPKLMVVRAASEFLPWVDGIQYLGVDPAAQSALLPSNYRPSLPPDLLMNAFVTKLGTRGLIAVLPDPLLLIPMGNARPIARQTVAQWLERQ